MTQKDVGGAFGKGRWFCCLDSGEGRGDMEERRLRSALYPRSVEGQRAGGGCRVTTPTFPGAGSGPHAGCILEGNTVLGQEDRSGDLGWPDSWC